MKLRFLRKRCEQNYLLLDLKEVLLVFVWLVFFISFFHCVCMCVHMHACIGILLYAQG